MQPSVQVSVWCRPTSNNCWVTMKAKSLFRLIQDTDILITDRQVPCPATQNLSPQQVAYQPALLDWTMFPPVVKVALDCLSAWSRSHQSEHNMHISVLWQPLCTLIQPFYIHLCCTQLPIRSVIFVLYLSTSTFVMSYIFQTDILLIHVHVLYSHPMPYMSYSIPTNYWHKPFPVYFSNNGILWLCLWTLCAWHSWSSTWVRNCIIINIKSS